MFLLVQYVLSSIGDEVAPHKFGGVFDISCEAGVPGVYEDLVYFIRVGRDGVWLGVVIGRASCVRDLVGVFVFDGLIGFFWRACHWCGCSVRY